MQLSVYSEAFATAPLIIAKAENIVVGYVQVTAIFTQEGAHLSVGYWLGQTYWGKGYATEALTALER